MPSSASTSPTTMPTTRRPTAGRNCRSCRAAPTMWAWPRWASGCTPSAASSNRTARRTTRPLPSTATSWNRIRRLPEACGAMACIALGGRIHLIGGAIGSDWRRSIDWHLVYDPATDRYERRQPLPVARDHTGIVVVGNAIHIIGGRVDSFHTNSNLHHSYDAATDRWTFRTAAAHRAQRPGLRAVPRQGLRDGRRGHEPRLWPERGLGPGRPNAGRPMRRCSRRAMAWARW